MQRGRGTKCQSVRWGCRAEAHARARADLHGKELAMRLMMHPDAEVQKQALLAVQKILLAKDKLAFLPPAS
jgi:hypothetical protein